MVDELTLVSGKTFPSNYVTESSGRLYIAIQSNSLAEIIEYFSNPEEVSTIYYPRKEFTGYTVFVGIEAVNSNETRVRLRKPYVGEQIG